MSGALTVYLARFPDQPAVVRLGRIERSTGRRGLSRWLYSAKSGIGWTWFNLFREKRSIRYEKSCIKKSHPRRGSPWGNCLHCQHIVCFDLPSPGG